MMDIGRPAVVRAIARARRRVSPPIPETLSEWSNIFDSDEWGPRLRNINGQMEQFYQGRLEVLRDDGTIHFVGIAFTNVSLLRQMSVHLIDVNTICMDGTFQIRPRQPQIEQLFTIQIIFNNVVSFYFVCLYV